MLAVRGLLDSHVPKELTNFLTIMKMIGLDIELSADIQKVNLSIHLHNNNTDALMKTRLTLIQTYYPEIEDEDGKLIKEAQERLVKSNPVMRLKADKTGSIDPSLIKKVYVPVG